MNVELYERPTNAGNKWYDLQEAIALMHIGDPPLRWNVEKSRQRSLSIVMTTWARRHGLRIRTFYHEGYMWIVRV